MTGPIRVVLVDDQQIVRAGFRMVIDSQSDLTVVGGAGDGASAVELLRTTAADVVLMDIRMPGTDGIEATRQVTALPEPPSVVVLTTFDLDEYVVTAIGAGASGFLLKDAPPEEMSRSTCWRAAAPSSAGGTRRARRRRRTAGRAARSPGGRGGGPSR
jgi:DNA-binding NarL/FixJ family response regulator